MWVALLGLALLRALPVPDETRVSLEAKDGDVKSVVSLLAEAGGVQPVFDPDVSCRLTLALKEAQLQRALESVLRACALGAEQDGKVLRVARVGQLEQEARQRRALKEEQEKSRPRELTLERLSYARAQELAPLLKKLLPAGSDVVFDARTNTLIIID